MRSMPLPELLNDAAAPAVSVSGISSDSRRARPGDLFVAVRGNAFDGHDFVADAVAAGAAAVVSERPLEADVPRFVLPALATRLGELASRFYAAPSEQLAVVGVTGTNGKTTVAHHVAAIADACGRGGGYVGTLGWGRLGALQTATLTTADAVALQARLRSLADDHAGVIGLEASSHALAQGRVDDVRFDVAVFTNLSRDHLDYHGSMRCYAAAKRRLFERGVPVAVVNIDDAVGRSIAENCPAPDATFSFGVQGSVRWADVAYRRDGLAGRWQTPWGSRDFLLPGLYGEFSLYNAAAALASCCALEVPLADVVDAMAELPSVPGRMQRVAEAPAVFVDYAHTPDALTAALTAAKAHRGAGGRVAVVFGCGGERDRGKRPAMAAAAEAGADVVFVTSDNPRQEDPQRIIDDAMAGFRAPAAVRCIVDRRQAIAAALAAAGADDVVLLAGKGHERTQDAGGRKLPFDDAQVARELLAQKPRTPAEVEDPRQPRGHR